MTLSNRIIEWELEFILNEKKWEFILVHGYDSFKEKINNKITIINKDNVDLSSIIKESGKSFYGYVDNNILIIKMVKNISPLNCIRPTFFYFSGEIDDKKKVLIGSFRRHNLFRLTSLFLLNAFLLQVIAYILYLVVYSRLDIDDSGFLLTAFGATFVATFIAIESRILRLFSKNEERQMYKLLSDLTE